MEANAIRQPRAKACQRTMPLFIVTLTTCLKLTEPSLPLLPQQCCVDGAASDMQSPTRATPEQDAAWKCRFHAPFEHCQLSFAVNACGHIQPEGHLGPP